MHRLLAVVVAAYKRRTFIASVLALAGLYAFQLGFEPAPVPIASTSRVGLSTAVLTVHPPPTTDERRLAVDAEAVPVDRYVATGRRTALIIGIDHARGARPLSGAVTDARLIKRAVRSYGFRSRDVTLLLDGAATKASILAAARSLVRRTPADGLAVFAIATHTRPRGGQKFLLAADGGLISASQLASILGEIRAPSWIALPTCYAGAYAVRGIIGRDRVVTFASSHDQPSYELGEAGSYLVINMVRDGMLEGRAPDSVESAFAFAKRELEANHPSRVPTMYDGLDGELALGPAPEAVTPSYAYRPPPPSGYAAYEAEPASASNPSSPPPERKRYSICGGINFRCNRS